MKNKIIVTGCNGGIGKEICYQLTNAGYYVIGIDQHDMAKGVDSYYCINLTNCEDVCSTFKTIYNEHGEGFYGLVNNAGLYEAYDFSCLTVSQYDVVMSVNVRAPLFLCQYFSNAIRENKAKGVIVNIASISGECGSKDVVYGVSKGAMINLTKSLSLALSPDIRVNSVSPGIIATPMSAKIPKERIEDYKLRILNEAIGKPEDIANAVVFLLSDSSCYINGATLSVNGGLH